MPLMYIPGDKKLRIDVDESFDVMFKKDGSITHDDHSCLHPPLVQKAYHAGETVTGLRGGSRCTVTITFTPKREHDLASTHTILIGN